MRVVLDTNVLVSGALLPDSVPGRFFDRTQLVDTLLFSEATFAELRSVLIRPKFDRYMDVTRRDRFLRRCLEISALIEVVRKIQACRDPSDDKFPEVVVNGDAEILVTGDADLLILDPFEGIPVIAPAEYLGRAGALQV